MVGTFCLACGSLIEDSGRKLEGKKPVLRVWKLICSYKLDLTDEVLDKISSDGKVCRYDSSKLNLRLLYYGIFFSGTALVFMKILTKNSAN